MSDFLLELRSEEIPARMQVKAADDLARLFAEELAKSGLKAAGIETLVTPRRLTLIARGLPVETQPVSEERKGPRANAPEQALAGFLRSTGLTREQLVERDGVFFAIIEKPGRPTAAVLAEAVPAVVRAFPWPKSMRWGAASLAPESLKWVRPLQGIVALFGEAIVPFRIDGMMSGATTLGHRFHHSGPITIGSADDYADKLRMCHVIVDHTERMAIIRDGATAAAVAAGLTMVPDEGLVAENAGLTEWPVPLLGRFDAEFLTVPPEVIQLTMRTNQKYFACTDAAGALANAFICTANIEASDGGVGIVAGNQKVLAARLSDAKFFWEQDLKVPLEEQAVKLSQIVFHEKLGTVADKVDRVAKLARWLIEQHIVRLGNADEEDIAHFAQMAETAARLCKADLVTGMVGEFPELQGVVGGYYAAAQGHDPQVSDAIRDHYKPVGQGDDVPTVPVTVAVSLADKLDTIFAFFGVDEYPTGSRDPFALRRAALAIAVILERNDIRLSIGLARTAFHNAIAETLGRRSGLHAFVGRGPKGLPFSDDEGKTVEKGVWRIHNFWQKSDFDWPAIFQGDPDWLLILGSKKGNASWDEYLTHSVFRSRLDPASLTKALNFFADRLKVQQREAGIRHDLIDAVFALGGEDDLVRLLARVKALQAFVTAPEGANLLSGYKRASNILKKENWMLNQVQHDGGTQEPLSYTPEPAEKALIDALDSAEPLATAAIAREDFE
ncbi:glycine--tRNA ligase subunit beta, partial [Sphingomonas sp.]|uniref:glycine--tRNA ligase subunit beta n=1 Tax=Sphingomonas sp. TaxID=28214 RepID=UPI0025DA8F8B